MRGEASAGRCGRWHAWRVPVLAHRGLDGPLEDRGTRRRDGGPARRSGGFPTAAPGERPTASPTRRRRSGTSGPGRTAVATRPYPSAQVPLVDLATSARCSCSGGFRASGSMVTPVFEPLAIPDDDLPGGEVDILHAQAEALHQAEPGAVHQAGHEPLVAGQVPKDGLHLLPGQDHGQTGAVCEPGRPRPGPRVGDRGRGGTGRAAR